MCRDIGYSVATAARVARCANKNGAVHLPAQMSPNHRVLGHQTKLAAMQLVSRLRIHLKLRGLYRRNLIHGCDDPLILKQGNPKQHRVENSQIMWVPADVVGLFSIKVGSRQRIFSANVVLKRRMLSGRAVYVLRPLQVMYVSTQPQPETKVRL